MNCKRCGQQTPRFTLTQRYCPVCEREVAGIVERDARRRAPRFSAPKSYDRFASVR